MASSNTILLCQFFNTFAGTGLSHLDDHVIITTDKSGIDVFSFALSHILESGTVELDYLFDLNHFTIDALYNGGNCDSKETHTGLTLGFFDHWELGFHFLSLFFLSYSYIDIIPEILELASEI